MRMRILWKKLGMVLDNPGMMMMMMMMMMMCVCFLILDIQSDWDDARMPPNGWLIYGTVCGIRFTTLPHLYFVVLSS